MWQHLFAFFFFGCTNIQSSLFNFSFAEISPYLDLALCPIRAEPWTCARQRSARILDVWDAELSVQWQKLKGERIGNRCYKLHPILLPTQVKEVLSGSKRTADCQLLINQTKTLSLTQM